MTAKLTDKQHAFVAAYLGPAERNATEAARLAGYRNPRQMGSETLSKPDVQAAIAEWREEVKTSAIALQEYRVLRLADLEARYVQLIEERAAALDGKVPGGGTGLLVQQTKIVRSGDDVEIVHEYKADTAVTKEIRDLLKQAAQELGQWTENKNVTVKMLDEYIIEVANQYGIDPAELAAELKDDL